MSRVGPKQVAEQPNSGGAKPARPNVPTTVRKGPDGFDDGLTRRPPPLTLAPREVPTELPRGRVLDPTLIPKVPPNTTVNPGKQLHVLLGFKDLRPSSPKPGAGKIDAKKTDKPMVTLPEGLPPQREKFLKGLLDGADSPGKEKLVALLASEDFQDLDGAAQKKALLGFNPRK